MSESITEERAKGKSVRPLKMLIPFISPYKAERKAAKARFEEGEFVEIFVNTPLDVAEQRDPKGLYKKSRHGKSFKFTGLNNPYDAQKNPNIEVGTSLLTSQHIAEQLVANMILKLELQP